MAKQEGKKRGVGLEEATARIRKVRQAYFLGIGIDDYQHFPKLSNAVKDVQDIAAALQQQYQFDPENIILLLNEQASRVGIINILDELVGRLTEENDLLIYYSGHGHLNHQTQKGFWIPCDAQAGSTADFISNATVKGYMEDIPAFHTFLISDSCFSGSLFVRGKMRSADEAIEELDSRPSRWALCSGRHDEEVYDGSPGENSPFASSILNQLRQSKSSALNVGRLVDEVVMQTRAQYRQLPEGNPMFDVGHQGGQFVFRLKYDDARDWASARAAHTAKAYENYLALYPEGGYAREAAQKLLELRDDEAWQTARAADALLAYDQYLEQFPEGRHCAEAIAAIRAFNDAEEWARAQQVNELWKYREYLQKYPDGQHAAEARASIEQLRARQGQAAETGPALGSPPTKAARRRMRTRLKASVEAHKAWYFLGGAIIFLSLVLLAVFWRPNRAGLGGAEASKPGLPAFDYVDTHPDYGSYYAIKQGGKWGFYNPNTGFVIEPVFDTLRPFLREMALVRQRGKYGWINKFGQVIIPIQYEQASAFGDDGLADVRLAGESFLIDRAGQRAESTVGRRERQAFEAALEQNTLQAYLDFLKKYPGGQFAEEAQQKTDILEQEAWQRAQEADRYFWYAQYLAAFPQGAYRTEAEAAQKRFWPDPRDGQHYRTAALSGATWMTENLNYQQAGQCYGQDTLHCQRYGRLYTWEEAQQACPPGWSLPTDAQWLSLANEHGGVRSAAFARSRRAGAGTRAYEELSDPKDPGFAAQLGGKKGAAFQDLGTVGYYWSGLRDKKTGEIYAYAFDGEEQVLSRIAVKPWEALSCRCVREVRGR